MEIVIRRVLLHWLPGKSALLRNWVFLQVIGVFKRNADEIKEQLRRSYLYEYSWSFPLQMEADKRMNCWFPFLDRLKTRDNTDLQQTNTSSRKHTISHIKPFEERRRPLLYSLDWE